MINISDKLLINLKIISKIQKNGRISRSYDGLLSLESDTMYQAIKRFIFKDSRRQTVFEINSIITETVDTMHRLLESKYILDYDSNSYIDSVIMLIEELEKCRLGIENLKFTYKSDENICSQIDIVILKINNGIKEGRNKLSLIQRPLLK